MFKWWKEWKENKRKARRENWEYDQLNEMQKSKYFSGKTKNISLQINDFADVVEAIGLLQDRQEKLDIRLELMKEMFDKAISNKKRRDGWRVIQEKDGETKWYRQDAIKYISNIYTSGPENTYFFDAIIDGEKITFSAPTVNEAQKLKFDLLDVERVEEFDQDAQREMFPEVNSLRRSIKS